jgi:hypothetical protein
VFTLRYEDPKQAVLDSGGEKGGVARGRYDAVLLRGGSLPWDELSALTALVGHAILPDTDATVAPHVTIVPRAAPGRSVNSL